MTAHPVLVWAEQINDAYLLGRLSNADAMAQASAYTPDMP